SRRKPFVKHNRRNRGHGLVLRYRGGRLWQVGERSGDHGGRRLSHDRAHLAPCDRGLPARRPPRVKACAENIAVQRIAAADHDRCNGCSACESERSCLTGTATLPGRKAKRTATGTHTPFAQNSLPIVPLDAVTKTKSRRISQRRGASLRR